MAEIEPLPLNAIVPYLIQKHRTVIFEQNCMWLRATEQVAKANDDGTFNFQPAFTPIEQVLKQVNSVKKKDARTGDQIIDDLINML